MDRDFDPRFDLDTEKIFQRVLPEKGWWPAPSDLIGKRAFRRRYAPRAAQVKPGLYFVFFERDPSLTEAEKRTARRSDDPRAHFELALLYRKHGLLDRAVASMRRAIALDPTNRNSRVNVAYFLYESGRYEDALREFEGLKRDSPGDARVSYGAALTLQKMGRLREAIPLWKRFLQEAPSSPFAPRAGKMLEEASKRM